MQKNALFFIFFATPSGLSSFFAFWAFFFVYGVLRRFALSIISYLALLERYFRFTHGLLSRQQAVFVFFPLLVGGLGHRQMPTWRPRCPLST